MSRATATARNDIWWRRTVATWPSGSCTSGPPRRAKCSTGHHASGAVPGGAWSDQSAAVDANGSATARHAGITCTRPRAYSSAVYGGLPRTSNAAERTERTELRQGERTERTEARQAGQTERTQARTDAAESVANNWDGRGYYYDDDDDDWGYAIAGAAVGAAVGFVAGAATAQAAAPTYVTVLPCTPVVVVATGVSYYRCDTLWYNRSYVNGNVAYVVVTAPPGY